MKLVSYDDGYDHQPEHDLKVKVRLSDGRVVEVELSENDRALGGVSVVLLTADP